MDGGAFRRGGLPLGLRYPGIMGIVSFFPLLRESWDRELGSAMEVGGGFFLGSGSWAFIRRWGRVEKSQPYPVDRWWS
jgi:hypothetical protein